MTLDSNVLLGGTVLVGVVAALWGKIKAAAWRVLSLFVVRVKLEDDAAVAFVYWCLKHLKKSPFGERRYKTTTEFVRPAERYLAVAFEAIGTDAATFWRGWRPLFVGLKVPGSNEPNNVGWQTVVTTFRGLFDVEAVLAEAMDLLNTFRHEGTRQGRYAVTRAFGGGPVRSRRYGQEGQMGDGLAVAGKPETALNPDRRILRWKPEDIGPPTSASPFAALVFPPEVQALADEVKRWLASEKWYKSKQIPWRRGYLLYGKPGTGKTSLVRAIAQELDLPVKAFDLTSFGNAEFVREWRNLMNTVPCVALIEDVDAVFDGRESRLGEEGGGLTFDCLLNCLSGIEAADGVLTFVTTNRIECLDPALGVPDGQGNSTRPGRIDRAVELPPLDDDCRRRLAGLIVGDDPGAIDELVEAGRDETGAQFSNRCAQFALRQFWEQKGAV